MLFTCTAVVEWSDKYWLSMAASGGSILLDLLPFQISPKQRERKSVCVVDIKTNFFEGKME